MLNFSINLTGLKNGKKLIEAEGQKILFNAMTQMQNIAKRRAPVNTGLLRASINLFPEAKLASEYILACGVDYGIYVEYGTSPHYPPISPLKMWSRRVLGDEGAAYAVQQKIAKQGTPAQPFFRPALDEVKNIYLPRLLRT
ncbi:MAG: hypothetical protein PWQ59_451 [Thermoanaerobacterium sp.]|nr:hypothetical protein [Thermoanaerobacterium sp.]